MKAHSGIILCAVATLFVVSAQCEEDFDPRFKQKDPVKEAEDAYFKAIAIRINGKWKAELTARNDTNQFPKAKVTLTIIINSDGTLKSVVNTTAKDEKPTEIQVDMCKFAVVRSIPETGAKSEGLGHEITRTMIFVY